MFCTTDKMKLSESGKHPKCFGWGIPFVRWCFTCKKHWSDSSWTPRYVHNGRWSVPSEKAGSTKSPVVKLDSYWMLLEWAHWEEENLLHGKFICECCIHTDFLVVLANDWQLQEFEHFCKNPTNFCVFSVDLTFNVFKDMILLTVTVQEFKVGSTENWNTHNIY